MTLASLTIQEAAKLIASHELSPVDLTQAILDRIKNIDSKISSYVYVMEDEAIATAKQAEADIMAGDYRGTLHGIPLGIKDLCDTKGVPTEAGSAVLKGRIPDTDATLVERLRKAGAVLVGKTRTHEFAWGGFTPGTNNPWKLTHIPGGSSGGSGAAIAADLCLGAIGTDTGGSIRIPASVNGIVGFKPTFGRVSKAGVFPLAWSLDHPGPMTKTVEDACSMLTAIAGWDQRDPNTVKKPAPDFSNIADGIKGITIGVERSFFFDQIHPDTAAAVNQAIAVLQELGATIKEIEIPSLTFTMAAEFAILMPEASTIHQKTLRHHADKLTADVRAWLELGELILGTHYLKAQKLREVIRTDIRRAYVENGLDVMVLPATRGPAAEQGNMMLTWGTHTESIVDAYVKPSAPFNLSGQPSLSVPCGFTSDGLPVGMQIVGRPFDEASCARVGVAYQSATDWHKQKPSI